MFDESFLNWVGLLEFDSRRNTFVAFVILVASTPQGWEKQPPKCVQGELVVR